MKLGIDLINENLSIFEGKRVGLITNPTGINSNYESTIDVLNEKVNLTCLFSPEHGVRGDAQAGAQVVDYIDAKTNLPVYSLFGGIHKPTKEMMDNVDVLCIDIQDVGSRFYTFLYTMSYAMEACKDFDKEFVVFDRPNPINAFNYEGNILDLKYRSFVGNFPILQRYGMTFGEIACLFNKEYEINCKLHVIKMEDYDRKMYWEDTKKIWVVPSPNIPTVDSAICYNATCQFEGTNMSEGRGTTTPFEIVGAPFVNPYEYSEKLNSLNLKGIYFRPMFFTPTFSKCKGELCGGVYLHVTNRDEFEPVKTGWAMIDVVRHMYPNDFIITPSKSERPSFFELETGGSFLKDDIYSLEELFALIEKETKEFGKVREKYLIY